MRGREGNDSERVSASKASEPVISLRVLIVEDEPMVAEAFQAFIETQRHCAEIVNHPDEVLSAVKRWKPDVVLLDIGLPGRSGYEVAAELATLEERAQMRVIALSGYAEDANEVRPAGGFDARLLKPVRMNELLRVLANTRPKDEPPSTCDRPSAQ